MGAQGINVGPLRRIPCQNMLARSDNDAGFAKQFLQIDMGIAPQSLISLQQILSAQLAAALEQGIRLGEQPQKNLTHAGVRRRDGKLRSPRREFGARSVSHKLKMGIQRPEQLSGQAGIIKGQNFR